MRRQVCLTALIILLLPALSTALFDDALQHRWTRESRGTVSGVVVEDLDLDGTLEVIVAYTNNDLIVFDRFGHYKYNITLPGNKDVGKIYALESGDLDGDGRPEIIVGFGALKEVKKYKVRQWELEGETTIRWLEKVLYQTTRNYGNLYVLDARGKVLWSKSLSESVQDLYVTNLYGDDKLYVIAGLGDFGIDTFNEYKGRDINGTEIWNLTEYMIQNGSIMVFTADGSVNMSQDIVALTKRGVSWVRAENTDNNVRTVFAFDIDQDKDKVKDILAGSDSGHVYAYTPNNTKLMYYNVSGHVRSVSAAYYEETFGSVILVGSDNGVLVMLDKEGNLLWKNRITGVVTSILVTDIDHDDEVDIVAGSTDRYIYVYDFDGNMLWKHFTGERVYDLIVADIDSSGYNELITSSNYNISVFEVDEGYVKRNRADVYYLKAEDYYFGKDYTTAMIYAQKSKLIYREIKLTEKIPKVELLIKRIGDEIRIEKQLEAELHYERALSFFAANDYRSSLTYVRRAQDIYGEIDDERGINKTNSLVYQIDRELIELKRIEADGYYAKAISYSSFGNRTGALKLLRLSKELYNEIGDINGTINDNRLIISISDYYYIQAEAVVTVQSGEMVPSVPELERALADANHSKQLYAEAEYYEGTAKSELLMEKIMASINKPPEPPRTVSSMLKYVIAGVFVIIVILMIVKKKSGAAG